MSSEAEPQKVRRSKPNCAKCKRHGNDVVLQGHKSGCPFKDCTCNGCNRINLILRAQKARRWASIKTNVGDRFCTRCQNHGHWNTFKGHRNKCPFKTCMCLTCTTGGKEEPDDNVPLNLKKEDSSKKMEDEGSQVDKDPSPQQAVSNDDKPSVVVELSEEQQAYLMAMYDLIAQSMGQTQH